jgi:hypothetical protein
MPHACMMSWIEPLKPRHSLAYAEMLYGIAMVVRNFELELFDTTWEDMEIKHDFFVSTSRLDSKHMRVKVKSMRS